MTFLTVKLSTNFTTWNLFRSRWLEYVGRKSKHFLASFSMFLLHVFHQCGLRLNNFKIAVSINRFPAGLVFFYFWWCFHGSEQAILVRLALLAEISPPCEIPCKICFRLHERRASPTKRDLAIDCSVPLWSSQILFLRLIWALANVQGTSTNISKLPHSKIQIRKMFIQFFLLSAINPFAADCPPCKSKIVRRWPE